MADEVSIGEPWDYKKFREKHLASFVTNVVEPCRDAFEAEDGSL